MLKSRYPDLTCSIARALEVVGERWSLLIVRDAIRGVSRFEDFHASLGLARNVLASRLEHLVSEGVLDRRPYGAGNRHAYQLTDKGRQLGVALVALQQWGDRHYPAPDGPPRLVLHDQCGGDVTARLICADDGAHLSASDLAIVPGPGGRSSLSKSTAQPADRQSSAQRLR